MTCLAGVLKDWQKKPSWTTLNWSVCDDIALNEQVGIIEDLDAEEEKQKLSLLDAKTGAVVDRDTFANAAVARVHGLGGLLVDMIVQLLFALGLLVHGLMKPENSPNNKFLTDGLFVALALFEDVVGEMLRACCSRQERRGRVKIFHVSDPARLSALLDNGFLTAVWPGKNASAAVECSAAHPVQFQYDFEKNMLAVAIAYEATNELTKTTKMRRNQKLNSGFP